MFLCSYQKGLLHLVLAAARLLHGRAELSRGILLLHLLVHLLHKVSPLHGTLIHLTRSLTRTPHHVLAGVVILLASHSILLGHLILLSLAKIFWQAWDPGV